MGCVQAAAWCLLASRGAGGEERPEVVWLRAHAIEMEPGSGGQDFSDLEPLREVLKDVRVVQLGEQSHGDGTVFETKTRLIRFLHQELGFDVLAFESGLYDCRKAWEAFRAGADPWEAAQQGVFAIWTESAQLEPLFEYVAAQARGERPLELAGFDCQFTARASTESLREDLRAAVAAVEPLILDEDAWLDFEAGLESLLGNAGLPEPEQQEHFHAGAAELAELFAASEPTDLLSARDLDYWRQLLRSIPAYARVSWESGDAGNLAERFNPRDAQMGENLVWLAQEHYPDRKIIVWAATMHIARNVDAIDTGSPTFSYDGVLPMGHYVHAALGEEAYSLGFIAQDGRAGNALRGEVTEIGPAAEGSLEALCHAAGLACAWIDLRQGAPFLHVPHAARPLGYSPMVANWSQIVDGFVFHRTMEPSQRRARPEDPESR